MRQRYDFDTPGNIIVRTLQAKKLEKIMINNGFTEVEGFHNSGYYPFLDKLFGNCRQFRSLDGVTVIYHPKSDIGSGLDYISGLRIAIIAENWQKTADENHCGIVEIISKFAEGETRRITETPLMDILLG